MACPPIWPRLAAGLWAVASLSLVLFLAGCQSSLFSGRPVEPERAVNPCLVLALPASGPFAQITANIRRGAEAGRQELLKKGVQVRLEDINTEEPDWLRKLSALPPACAVVGGLLQEKSYQAARKAGLLQQRAFFVFEGRLQEGDEGRLAWRFFPSAQDQMDALVGFATDQMNMRTYGALYPDDTSGRRLTQSLEQTLKKRNMPLQKATYTPNAPAAIKSAAAQLVMPKRGADGRTMVPQTMFEALFLPDSWKNMDTITSSLRANGEDRLALLGPTFWEQGLAGKHIPNAERYALAVFPAAWNPSRQPAALKGNGDFWSTLGYDFVKFGANIALAMRPEAGHITSRAQRAAAAVHGLAPLYWDDSGIAHQKMYLFQVTSAGMKPLDATRFSQARAAAAERAALRMQGFNESGYAAQEAAAEEPARPAAREVNYNPGPIYSEPAVRSAEPAYAEPATAEPAISEPGPVYSEPASANPGPIYSEPAQPRRPTAPAPVAQPEPAPPVSNETGIMFSTPRPSHKLSLPVKQ